eukprot:CAMPEP_0175064984 /NCGR_PEP_ID=MMETSP0052_2-20121109/15653_1 /TAXON_ID=51329 ORGANISM="Polytomella parva, Strain SAG 63-3" /NCGR_SAMPLE_ID=MMETSP0052_2 /ASSEMBLY_ACC=CAM_ASM_000194 /LENGTH=194 /DNA_ID=CAMNT_0016331429 /DNA_START=66 /DNA_END=646 /DNA_ORIENTATION=-
MTRNPPGKGPLGGPKPHQAQSHPSLPLEKAKTALPSRPDPPKTVSSPSAALPLPPSSSSPSITSSLTPSPSKSHDPSPLPPAEGGRGAGESAVSATKASDPAALSASNPTYPPPSVWRLRLEAAEAAAKTAVKAREAADAANAANASAVGTNDQRRRNNDTKDGNRISNPDPKRGDDPKGRRRPHAEREKDGGT